jgi:hypothetical protein
VVQDNKVIIVDEHTGRPMAGRRWSDGLHQAVEAKEEVEIERETQTLATITIQNYFRLYTKLAGMTGTAETEAQEFFDIYKLGVLTIPSNRPCIRKDSHDTVYKTRREKFQAVINEIKKLNAEGRPVLVGTISVETSEMLARALKKEGIPHAVLNAKFHQQEAEIVSNAGQRGAVTIATNMAGRGTDIKLGAGVAEVGGLHVLATERHESRRILHAVDLGEQLPWHGQRRGNRQQRFALLHHVRRQQQVLLRVDHRAGQLSEEMLQPVALFEAERGIVMPGRQHGQRLGVAACCELVVGISPRRREGGRRCRFHGHTRRRRCLQQVWLGKR